MNREYNPIYNLLYVINSELNKDFCPCYYNTSALSDMAEKKVRPPYSLCVRWLHKRFPKQGAKKLYYVHTSTTYIPACPSFRFFFECVCFCLKIENLAAAFGFKLYIYLGPNHLHLLWHILFKT